MATRTEERFAIFLSPLRIGFSPVDKVSPMDPSGTLATSSTKDAAELLDDLQDSAQPLADPRGRGTADLG